MKILKVSIFTVLFLSVFIYNVNASENTSNPYITINSNLSFIGFSLGMDYEEAMINLENLRKTTIPQFDKNLLTFDEENKLESIRLYREYLISHYGLNIQIDKYKTIEKPYSFKEIMKNLGIDDKTWKKEIIVGSDDSLGDLIKYTKEGIKVTYYKTEGSKVKTLWIGPEIKRVGPIVKGFQLGMEYKEALSVANDNRKKGITLEFSSDKLKHTSTIVAFGGYANNLKKSFNVEEINVNFLNEFLNAYGLKGENITFSEFQKRYNYILSENARWASYFPPMVEEYCTFIDCGSFCVVFLEELRNGMLKLHDAFLYLVSKKAYRGHRNNVRR